MAIESRDPHTGYLTTGHEWNGITELNTPVPRPVIFFLVTTFVFAVVYWILMPAWPLGSTYTRGMLGFDQRAVLAADLKQASVERAGWIKAVETGDYAAIQGNDGLMRNVRETGKTLFGDNCAACHGVNGTGGPGFPNLAVGSWLWGGTPEAIARTIQVGINSTHEDTRVSQMPAFGKDDMLPRKDIEAAILFVRSLSDPALATGSEGARVRAGQSVFVASCASCHGENAKGNIETGGPDLTDANWIYGGSASAIAETLERGRQGQMPTWDARLSPIDRKILTLYVLDLGRRAP